MYQKEITPENTDTTTEIDPSMIEVEAIVESEGLITFNKYSVPIIESEFWLKDGVLENKIS